MARIAFKIAITETPTSANTAAHIFAYPKAPKISTRNFTPKANTIFWFAMRMVFLAIRITEAILEARLSLEQYQPLQSPHQNPNRPLQFLHLPCQHRSIVDSVSDKYQFSFFAFLFQQFLYPFNFIRRKKFRICLIQTETGRNFLTYASASPVSIIVLRTPEDFKSLIAAGASVLISSSMTIHPAYLPLQAM